MLKLSLRDFPLVIEPTVTRLEAKSCRPAETFDIGELPAKLNWSVLHRISPVDVHQDVEGLPGDLVHFFGDAPDLAECYFLVAYLSSGVISRLLVINEFGWEHVEFPEEMTGQVVVQPAVRLMFCNEKDREEFLVFLAEAESLGRVTLFCPPRLTAVACG